MQVIDHSLRKAPLASVIGPLNDREQTRVGMNPRPPG